MRTRRSWLARVLMVLVVMPVLPPAPASSFDGPGCAMEWNQKHPTKGYADAKNSGASGLPGLPKACTFSWNGTPLQISGDASHKNASANVSIRVWVSPAGSPEVALAECSASDSGYVSCGTEITPIAIDARRPITQGGTAISLQCNFSFVGNREGSAGCYNPEPCVAGLTCVSVLGQRLDCMLDQPSCD